MPAKMSFMLRIMRPGSVELPTMVCVLPEPVDPIREYGCVEALEHARNHALRTQQHQQLKQSYNLNPEATSRAAIWMSSPASAAP